MPAQLVALDHGPSILLDKPILLLGRHPECDIQIDSRKISRRHCCIAQVSDYLVVRDLGSTNGIRINGIRLMEGRLTDGDELTIGNYRYKVTWEAVPGAAAPVSPPRPALRKGAGDERAARRKTIRDPAAAMAGMDDELLESCDDPVPLAEPGAADSPVGRAPKPPEPASPPPAEQDQSVHLPEQMELMPKSDLFGNNAPPASHSSIHS